MAGSDLHVEHHKGGESGPPVVIVHGAPDRSKNFAQVVERLTDVPITVYDRRGYGKSIDAAIGDGGAVLGGLATHAADLLDLIGETPSVVVGQSVGGTIAMLAAAQSPEQVLALGVWEPPMVAYDWWKVADVIEHTLAWGERDDPLQVGEDINRMILGEERWQALRPETRDLLCREGAAFRADMATQATALFELDDLVVPFLVGRGTEMGPAFISGADELARRAGAETFVGVGVDHYAHLNAPDTWAELVRRTIALAPSPG